MTGHGIARRSALGLLAGAATLAVAGCGLMMSTASFHYRMTVEGAVSGSAVYELLAERVNGPRLADETPGGSIILGEALVLETPKGPVFVLLKSSRGGYDLKDAVLKALAPDWQQLDQPWGYAVANRLEDAREGEMKAALPRADWPLMVRFGDISDPKTVEQVDPDTIGVKRIVLETTRADVTTGIEKRIPSFSASSGFDKWYADLRMDDPRRVTLDDFSSEIGQ